MCQMLKRWVVCALWVGWIGGLCVGLQRPAQAQADKAETSSKAPQKQAVKRSYLGDVVLRLDPGVQVLRYSNTSGEGLLLTVGPQNIDIQLQIEYGYYWKEQTVLFLALPLGFEYDPVVALLFTGHLSLGLRQFFSLFFVDVQLNLLWMKRNILRVEFGGLLVGAGIVLPLSERVRLTFTARLLFQFDWAIYKQIDFKGIRLGLNTMAGVEIFL